MQSRRVGLIGAGNMAGALIRGLLQSGTLAPDGIRASDVRPARLAELSRAHGIVTHTANRELVEWANLIVLCVKPQLVDRVLDEIGGAVATSTLFVSVAAGVPIRSLETRLAGGVPVVRAMPNAAAIVLESATAIAPGSHASDDHLRVAKSLFDAVGKAVVLEESAIDAVTGLAGSGPAYVMLMLEALADGGVKVGLGRETALLLAAQTLLGSAKLQLESGEHPARLKDVVTSPGGTAISGLHALERAGLRRALMDAVESATDRAAELGAEQANKLDAR
jgi:pyrroline-5-carboxylate reductase